MNERRLVEIDVVPLSQSRSDMAGARIFRSIRETMEEIGWRFTGVINRGKNVKALGFDAPPQEQDMYYRDAIAGLEGNHPKRFIILVAPKV